MKTNKKQELGFLTDKSKQYFGIVFRAIKYGFNVTTFFYIISLLLMYQKGIYFIFYVNNNGLIQEIPTKLLVFEFLNLLLIFTIAYLIGYSIKVLYNLYFKKDEVITIEY